MNQDNKEVAKYSRYTRFGTWIAVVSLLSIILVESFRHFSILRQKVHWTVGGIVCFSVVLLLLDPDRYRRHATPEEILRFHKNPHYWGAATLTCAAVLFLLVPRERPIAAPVFVPPPVVLVKEEPPPEIVFPELSVSAVVLNGQRSSATINGKEVWIGEGIQGVILMAVSETNIVVEMKGVRKDIANLNCEGVNSPGSQPDRTGSQAGGTRRFTAR